MKKLIAIIGIPGTGKSTVMREWMSKRDWKTDRPVDLVDSHVSDKVRVIGKYEKGETFSGTDRLSMAVQPKFLEFLRQSRDEVVLFEGDRLTSTKVFKEAQMQGWEVQILHLYVSTDERKRRYEERGSNQDEKFIQGRVTKVNNVVEQFGPVPLFGEEGCVVSFQHEDQFDTARLVDLIEDIVTS